MSRIWQNCEIFIPQKFRLYSWYLIYDIVHSQSFHPVGIRTSVETREEREQIGGELGERVMGIANGMKELNDVGGAERTNEVEQEGKPHV